MTGDQLRDESGERTRANSERYAAVDVLPCTDENVGIP